MRGLFWIICRVPSKYTASYTYIFSDSFSLMLRYRGCCLYVSLYRQGKAILLYVGDSKGRGCIQLMFFQPRNLHALLALSHMGLPVHTTQAAVILSPAQATYAWWEQNFKPRKAGTCIAHLALGLVASQQCRELLFGCAIINKSFQEMLLTLGPVWQGLLSQESMWHKEDRDGNCGWHRKGFARNPPSVGSYWL